LSTTQASTRRADAFSLLSNPRRRYAVRACQQLETPVELGELAEYIAAEECDKSISEITGEERRRVYTSLQQVHIDKLEDAGVIECERKTITPTEKLEELEFYLEVVPGDEIPWAEYYLGLSAVAGALVAAAWFRGVSRCGSGLRVGGVGGGVVRGFGGSTLLSNEAESARGNG